MKVTVLGSGSPEAYARRASSGYLVEVAGNRLLFDCGGGVFDNLLRAGHRPSEIDHLFFSHLHSDHMMDYARLIHAAWEEANPEIHVFGPHPIKHITKGYFGPDGVLAHDLRARTEFAPSQEVWTARGGTLPRPWPAPIVQEITPGFRYEGTGWRLSSCEVPHAQPHLACMAFRLECGGNSLVYSGDAGRCDALETLAQDADLLIHWCYRLDGESADPVMERLSPTPSEIADMAARVGVKRLVLSHFRTHMDAEGCHEAALAAMAERFDGPASIAEDLDSFTL